MTNSCIVVDRKEINYIKTGMWKDVAYACNSWKLGRTLRTVKWELTRFLDLHPKLMAEKWAEILTDSREIAKTYWTDNWNCCATIQTRLKFRWFSRRFSHKKRITADFYEKMFLGWEVNEIGKLSIKRLKT